MGVRLGVEICMTDSCDLEVMVLHRNWFVDELGELLR